MSSLEVNNRYSIADGIAYTEDKIPIHKLCAVEISCTTKDKDVFAYFSQFGEVVKMCLRPERKRKRYYYPKSVTIQYADARAAATVLQEPNHILEKKIHVSACNSWEQPDALKSNDDEEIATTAQNSDDMGACVGATTAQSAPPLNILDLNDDCLEHIAKFLKRKHQVRMARTCTRFRAAVEMRARVQYKQIWLKKLRGMTLWDIREFFLIAGPTIKKIIGELPSRYKEQVVELIADNCPHVMSLFLESGNKRTSTLHRLIMNMNNITELHLHDTSITDNDMTVIQNLPKLQQLSLADSFQLTGKYISTLTTVRKLNLSGCCNIEPANFVDIIKSMKGLMCLDIQRCMSLTTIAFEEIEKNCHNLLILKISSIPIPCYGYVARLPSLIQLDLACARRTINDSLFTLLVEHKSTQLQHFKINSENCINLRRAERIAQLSQLKSLIVDANKDLKDDCLYQFAQLEQLEDIILSSSKHFTKDGLLYLIQRCTKLNVVNLQYCTQIKNDFIFDVIELMEKRQQGLPQDPAKKPLTFYVLKSGIKNSIIEDARYKNASALVCVVFYLRVTRFFMYEHCLNEGSFGEEYECIKYVDEQHDSDDYDDSDDSD